MSKIIFSGSAPVSQSVEAVRALLNYQGKVYTEMPAFYRLSPEMVLVRSSKGDMYYVVTPTACSCPSATYRPGKACKHQRAYFPPQTTPQVTEDEKNDSIRPDMRGFRPFSLLPGEKVDLPDLGS